MKQSDIVKKIRKLGYKVTVLNAHPANRGGIPDVLISANGIPIFIEIKIDNDKLSKLQKEFILEFEKCSYVLHYNPKTSFFKFSYMASMGYYELDYFMSILIDKLNASPTK